MFGWSRVFMIRTSRNNFWRLPGFSWIIKVGGFGTYFLDYLNFEENVYKISSYLCWIWYLKICYCCIFQNMSRKYHQPVFYRWSWWRPPCQWGCVWQAWPWQSCPSRSSWAAGIFLCVAPLPFVARSLGSSARPDKYQTLTCDKYKFSLQRINF